MHSWSLHTHVNALLVEQHCRIMIHRQKKKGGDDVNVAISLSLSFFDVCWGRERMKNFITHSYCGIMNFVSLRHCFLLLCYYILLESFMLMIVQGSYMYLSNRRTQRSSSHHPRKSSAMHGFPCDNNLCLTTTTFENKWMRLASFLLAPQRWECQRLTLPAKFQIWIRMDCNFQCYCWRQLRILIFLLPSFSAVDGRSYEANVEKKLYRSCVKVVRELFSHVSCILSMNVSTSHINLVLMISKL